MKQSNIRSCPSTDRSVLLPNSEKRDQADNQEADGHDEQQQDEQRQYRLIGGRRHEASCDRAAVRAHERRPPLV